MKKPTQVPIPSRGRGWRTVALTLLIPVSLWTVAALGLDMKPTWARSLAVAGYLGMVGALFVSVQNSWRRLGPWLALNVLVIVWWLNLKPSANENWAPEFARQAWSEQTGERVTIHDVRNFTYRTETDFTVNWETRTIDLSQIQGADLFLTHWGVPLIAHSMVSFRFADGTYLATSIEARRTVNQEFSALRGFFRQFQVSYLISDERDVVRLRTNYRHDEEVYLYRTRLKPADARALFQSYLGWMNAARARPQWYNALTRNCSTPITIYLAKTGVGGISRWDLRGVLDGSGDKMLYELGDLVGDNLPFAELKRQAWINPAAHAADTASDFSQKIRANRAGFGP